MLHNRKNLVGHKFGRLTVIKETNNRKYNSIVWLCRCDCGNYIEIASRCLVTKRNRSCGCLLKERSREILIKNSEKLKSNLVENTKLSILNNKISKTNTSGVRGVYFDNKLKKWVATIEFQKKKHYLGSFLDINKAKQAREKAEKKYFEPILDKYKKE